MEVEQRRRACQSHGFVAAAPIAASQGALLLRNQVARSK
jgi:hypothetical protein